MIALTASLGMVVSGYIKSGAKTEATVRVRPRIVQIERAQPGVRAIVPVAPRSGNRFRVFIMPSPVAWR